MSKEKQKNVESHEKQTEPESEVIKKVIRIEARPAEKILDELFNKYCTYDSLADTKHDITSE